MYSLADWGQVLSRSSLMAKNLHFILRTTMTIDKTSDLQEARVSVVSVRSPGELQLLVFVFFSN